MIGKAYSGLTDKEIEEMMVKIKASPSRTTGTSGRSGPSWSSRSPSTASRGARGTTAGSRSGSPGSSGYATDKDAEQIDTLEKVREIYASQKVTSEP